MHKIKTFLDSKPVFLYLLPLFFVLHTFSEYAILAPFKESAELCLLYLGCGFLLSILFNLFFKNIYKASFLAFCILCYQLFFGSIHDLLKSMPLTLLARYSFIFPFTFLLFAGLVIFLKRKKTFPALLTGYLNWLLILLIGIDILASAWKFHRADKVVTRPIEAKAVPCDSCIYPDVYLIITDEYAGQEELHDIFSFDNSDFENALKSRGFHLTSHTRSNYNYTVYSMASLLNMGYLENISPVVNLRDMYQCRELINRNRAGSLFEQLGYDMYNCSFFEFMDKKHPIDNAYFPPRKALFTAQTFTSRVLHNIGFHFAGTKRLDDIRKQDLYNDLRVDSLTRKVATIKGIRPKFVYTHFTMPHHTYFLDKEGRELRVQPSDLDKNAYLGYLQYANTRLLSLIDHIRQQETRPALIILMSDHGFRQFTGHADKKYYFMNLNAVYFPNGNYSGFYEGMSNVNQFRVIFHSQFGQQFPLLRDSTVFLKE